MTKECRPDLVFIILSIRADKSIAHKVWQTEMGTTYSLLSSVNIIIKGTIFFNIYITFSVCTTTSSTSGSATTVLLKQNSRGIFEEDRSFISGRHAGLHPCKKWKSLKGTFQNCRNESPGISALLPVLAQQKGVVFVYSPVGSGNLSSLPAQSPGFSGRNEEQEVRVWTQTDWRKQFLSACCNPLCANMQNWRIISSSWYVFEEHYDWTQWSLEVHEMCLWDQPFQSCGAFTCLSLNLTAKVKKVTRIDADATVAAWV